MIIELMLAPFWKLISLLIEAIPPTSVYSLSSSSIYGVLSKGVGIIGADNFAVLLGNGIFWYTVQSSWSLIEWLYKKVPGVD